MLDGTTYTGWKMSHYYSWNLFWVVKNPAGYHPRPATPSTTDGAQFVLIHRFLGISSIILNKLIDPHKDDITLLQYYLFRVVFSFSPLDNLFMYGWMNPCSPHWTKQTSYLWLNLLICVVAAPDVVVVVVAAVAVAAAERRSAQAWPLSGQPRHRKCQISRTHPCLIGIRWTDIGTQTSVWWNWKKIKVLVMTKPNITTSDSQLR